MIGCSSSGPCCRRTLLAKVRLLWMARTRSSLQICLHLRCSLGFFFADPHRVSFWRSMSWLFHSETTFPTRCPPWLISGWRRGVRFPVVNNSRLMWRFTKSEHGICKIYMRSVATCGLKATSPTWMQRLRKPRQIWKCWRIKGQVFWCCWACVFSWKHYVC